MAKQTEIGYAPTKSWQDFQTGGTRVDAADLNNMEQGIADACSGVDELRTKRLPTYLVASGGDTATQDVYSADILGPCLIVDLATATTYYDNGEDDDAHERTKLVSGADIDSLRDSVSQCAQSRRGALLDITYANLQTLNPGCYSVGNGSSTVAGDPTGSTYSTGWIIVFSASEHRIAAITALSGNSGSGIYVSTRLDADNWVRVATW